MKKFLRVAFWVACCAVGALVIIEAAGLWIVSHKGYAFADGDLPKHLNGRWDWTTRAKPCGDSAHVIAIAPDRRTMTISVPPHLADTGYTATYDILKLTPSRVRGAIRGEKRLTDSGAPVVWDLIMFSPDEYHWQRTDWKPWGFTAGIIRCGAAPRDSA